MKTRSLVLIGVMVIALAAMAMPVMADGENTGGTAGGSQNANVSIDMNNKTPNFGIFVIGNNVISPSHYSTGGFPEIVVFSNENSWQVSVLGNHDFMTSTAESYNLSKQMTIATVSSSATGETTGFTGNTDGGKTLSLISPGNSFITGGSMDRGNMSLSLTQNVIPRDKASSTYSMAINVVYHSIS
jgi:hypothetical protein